SDPGSSRKTASAMASASSMRPSASAALAAAMPPWRCVELRVNLFNREDSIKKRLPKEAFCKAYYKFSVGAAAGRAVLGRSNFAAPDDRLTVPARRQRDLDVLAVELGRHTRDGDRAVCVHRSRADLRARGDRDAGVRAAQTADVLRRFRHARARGA